MKSLSFEKKKIIYAAIYPLLFIGLLWLIEFLKIGMNWNLSFFGIIPQSKEGVLGIFTHYLVHQDINHLWSNTISLFVLGWMLFYFYGQIAWRTIGGLWILIGLLLWIMGRSGVHIGASGLIYGLTFFLIFSGILRMYSPLIAVSLIVVFLYGSTTWGIFPFAELVKKNISWEGHLSGALSGVFLAIAFRKKGPQKPPPLQDNEEDDEDEDEYAIFSEDIPDYQKNIMEQDHTRSHPKDGNEPNAL